MKLLLVVFIILNLNYLINSLTINFNTSLVQQCTNVSLPCDLSSHKYWENNEIPTNGDDIVIDLSSVSKTNIYLIADNLSINLNSFTLNGQETNQNYFTQLILQNSNLNILNQFNIQYSNLTINELESSNSNSFNFNEFNSNSSLLLISGFSNISINSLSINGPDRVYFNNSVQFSVKESSVINSVIQNTCDDNGLLSFSGETEILKFFFSNAQNLYFGGNTTISASCLIDQVLIGGNLSIVSPNAMVTIDNYAFTSSNFIINLLDGSYFTTSGLAGGNSYFRIGAEINIMGNSSLVLPSGCTVTSVDSDVQMSGTIQILSGLATFNQFNTPNVANLDIYSQGNVSITSLSVKSITIMNNGVLTFNGQSNNVHSIIGYNLVISTGSSLSIIGYSSIVHTTVLGVLAVFSNLLADHLILSMGGKLQLNSLSSIGVNFEFTMTDGATISITDPVLNSFYPLISVFFAKGVVNLQDMFINVEIDSSIKIAPGDFIYVLQNLFGTNNILPQENEVTVFSDGSLLPNSEYFFSYDGEGHVKIEFPDSQKEPFATYKICLIVIIPSLVIVGVVGCFIYQKKKRIGEKQPLI